MAGNRRPRLGGTGHDWVRCILTNHCRRCDVHPVHSLSPAWRLREGSMAKRGRTKTNHTMTPEKFTLDAITTLREGVYKGIHTVYSGFNEAFRLQFPDLDPIVETKKLSELGKIVIRVVRGGAIIYRPGDAPAVPNKGDEVLKRMGLR